MPSISQRPPKQKQKADHQAIVMVRLCDIRPAPENDKLYRPVDPSDSAIVALSESIREHGLREPLVLSRDGYILSGHRRHAAATLAGLEHVPCRYESITRADDIDGFIVLLREFNRQRVKSLDEQIREAVIDADPEEARAELLDYRRDKSKLGHVPFLLGGYRARSEITAAKQPFLDAILLVLEEQREYWPLSDRQIHYQLAQNHQPLKHASKADSIYRNDVPSYKALCDLLTRGRVAGLIPYEAIGDTTRPVVSWDVYDDPGEFIAKEVRDFLKGGYRNLMMSQPNHIEVVVEKNTVASIVQTVCMDFTIKMISGRGYCSLPPRYEMAKRFRASGKEKLIVVMVSDFDPEGESIVEIFGRSMRDDFDIATTHIAKAALTAEQVKEYGLPPAMEVKMTSSRAKGFVAKHGSHVWELEALPPKTLQDIVRAAIVSVLDLDAFNAEQRAETVDAVGRKAVRETFQEALKSLRFDSSGSVV